MNFKPENLREFISKVFVKNGVCILDSNIIADSLVQANLRGIDSHGVARVPIYIKRIKVGAINSNPNIKIVESSNSTILIDGDNGMGQVVGSRAMDIAIENAKINGGSFVGVMNSNHYGTGSYFVEKGVTAGMITFAYSNAPSTMAPWGGVSPYLGTNPYSFGAPGGQFKPIILDMASSVVARGKIILAAQKGEGIPEGWAIDRDGNPTTDAQKALEGSVLPFAGPKGYGIALMIDIMCGILTGAGFGKHINNIYGDFDKTQNVGHFFKVIDIEKFMSINVYQSRIEMIINEIKHSARAERIDEIFMPGEIWFNQEQRNSIEGITLNKVVFEELREEGKDCGLDLLDYCTL